MVISIDTGNKQIKTEQCVFSSGLVPSNTKPPFDNDCLSIDGVYYTLTNQRIPYMWDKTKDERYFLLTLFGIAYELNKFQPTAKYEPITLLTGLPPAHFGLKKAFIEYFQRGAVKYEFNGIKICININKVYVFPQAFAAIASEIGDVMNYTKTIILDIGGFTADVLKLFNGKLDSSIQYSDEHSTIQFYNYVKDSVKTKFDDLLLDEADIDALINDTHGDIFSLPIKNHVNELAKSYIRDYFNSLRERGIDLKSCYTVLVGGGVSLF